VTTDQRQFARTQRRHTTSAEDVLWQGRRLAGLKFRRQVPLLAYTLDFLCVERRLVVELDGSGHERMKAYDHQRTREIEAHGLQVIRFRNERVLQDIDAVLAVIAAAAGEITSPRDPSPPTPLPFGRGEKR
jgi:very-short-patch-repair endonuclease